ncbi:MAG: hypothetical protein HDR38_00870 [Treponema sp.]|nr:hypothetical protein [Treponema sp.]
MADDFPRHDFLGIDFNFKMRDVCNIDAKCIVKDFCSFVSCAHARNKRTEAKRDEKKYSYLNG